MPIALLLFASLALGQNTFRPPASGTVNPFEEPDESELFRLDEQLVTVASRYAQTVRKAPSIVTLVTSEQIRNRGYRKLSDLLRDLPGIYVWRSPEGRDLASFRGILSDDNNKILLLVDGVPWYDGVYTHAFIDEYLPIAHVRQVEVIKGPGSAIYGTNAFAGVINVVTWGASDLDGARVRVTGGGWERLDAMAMAGGRRRIGALDTSVMAYVRAFSQQGPGLEFTPHGTRDALESDERRALNVGARMRLGDLHVQVHHVDYRQSYLVVPAIDPYEVFGKDTDVNGLFHHNTFFDVRYELELGQALELTPNFWSQRHDNPGGYFFFQGYDTQEVADGVFETTQRFTLMDTEKDTRRWGFGIDAEARPGLDHHTVAGVGTEYTAVLDLIDLAYVDGDPDPVFTGFGVERREGDPPRRLCNLFGFAQHSFIPTPGLELTGGARVDRRYPCHPADDRSAASFGAHVSPRLGVLVVPSDRATLKLLHGWAFRYPNVRELLVLATLRDDGLYEFATGNPDLAPESVRTSQAELTADLADNLQFRTDFSHSWLLREIDKVYPPNRYENLPGSLHILAAEAEATARFSGLELRAAYAFLWGAYDDQARDFAGRGIYEIPPHMGKGSVGYAFTDRISATLLGEVYSVRPRRAWSPTAGVADGPPFGLAHLAVRAAELGREGRTEIGVSVRNLTNTRFDTGVYRDDVDVVRAGEPRFPQGIEGERRTVHVTLEVAL